MSLKDYKESLGNNAGSGAASAPSASPSPSPSPAPSGSSARNVAERVTLDPSRLSGNTSQSSNASLTEPAAETQKSGFSAYMDQIRKSGSSARKTSTQSSAIPGTESPTEQQTGIDRIQTSADRRKRTIDNINQTAASSFSNEWSGIGDSYKRLASLPDTLTRNYNTISGWSDEAKTLGEQLTQQYNEIEKMSKDRRLGHNASFDRQYREAIESYNAGIEEYNSYLTDIDAASSAYTSLYDNYQKASAAYTSRPEEYTSSNIGDYKGRIYLLATKPEWTDEDKAEAKEILKAARGTPLGNLAKVFGAESNAQPTYEVGSKAGPLEYGSWENIRGTLEARTNKAAGLAAGLFQGTGMMSAIEAMTAGINKLAPSGSDLKKLTDEALGSSPTSMRSKLAYAQQNAPIAFAAGNVAGNIALFSAISAALPAVGTTAAGAGKVFQQMANSAATMAGATAIQKLGDAVTGRISAGEYFKDIAVAAGGGTIGSALASGVTRAGLALMQSTPKLASSGIARTVLAGVNGMAYAAGSSGTKEGVNYFSTQVKQLLGYDVEEYKVNYQQLAKDVISAGVFAALNYSLRQAFTTKSSPSSPEQKRKYFEDCNDMDALKKKMRQYTKDLHPDLHPGQSAEDASKYAEIMEEYNRISKDAAFRTASATSATGKASEARAAGKPNSEAEEEIRETIQLLQGRVADGSITDAETVGAIEALAEINGTQTQTNAPAVATGAAQALTLPEVSGTGSEALVAPAATAAPEVPPASAPQALSLPSLTGEAPQPATPQQPVRSAAELPQTTGEQPQNPSSSLPAPQRLYNLLINSENTAIGLKDYLVYLYPADEKEGWLGQIYIRANDGGPGDTVYEVAARTKEEAADSITGKAVDLSIIPADESAGPVRTNGTVAGQQPAVNTAQPTDIKSGEELRGLSLPTPEAGTAAPEITQPETGGISNGNPATERTGTEQRPQPSGSPAAAEQPGTERADIYGGGSERPDRQRAGVQDGRVAERSAGEWKPNAAYQGRAVSQRSNNEAHTQLVRVSATELGVPGGTTYQTLRVYPQELWDDELTSLDTEEYNRSGNHITFVLGSIDRAGANGQIASARGVNFPDGRKIIRADHRTLTASQIKWHEDWHTIEREDPGIHEEAMRALREKYGDQKIDRILDKYFVALQNTVDIPDNPTGEEMEELMKHFESELLADAYGQINFSRTGSDSFHDDVQRITEQRGAIGLSQQNAAATSAITGPPRYSFGGTFAVTADMDAKNMAGEMEYDGAGSEEIRKRTGWFRGLDGKWRFEIDDSAMKLIVNPKEIPTYTSLGEIIQHDDLFKAYPNMRNMDVMFLSLGEGHNGSYNRQLDSITLNKNLRDRPWDLMDSLVHEIQHAIQERETFANGSSPEYWQTRIDNGYDTRTAAQKQEIADIYREFRELAAENPEIAREAEALINDTPKIPRGEVNWDTLEQVNEDPPEWQAWDERRDRLEEKYGEDFWDLFYALTRVQEADKMKGRDAYTMYRDTAGEVEARNAADRRNLTASEREAIPPVTSYHNVTFAEKAASFSSDEARTLQRTDYEPEWNEGNFSTNLQNIAWDLLDYYQDYRPDYFRKLNQGGWSQRDLLISQITPLANTASLRNLMNDLRDAPGGEDLYYKLKDWQDYLRTFENRRNVTLTDPEPITPEQNGGIPDEVAQAYYDDVTDPRGGQGRAGDIFDTYVLRRAGDEVTPFIYTSNYNHNSPIAKGIKKKDPVSIAIAAEEMQAYVPHDSVLIPMPGHNGRADDTLELANTIAELYNQHHPNSPVEVLDALAGSERPSQYETKKNKHRSLSLEEMGMHTIADIPEDKLPVFIDNVVASGTTAMAAQKAVGRGMTLAFAYGNRTKPVDNLKLANPVTYDDEGKVIPVTERFNPEHRGDIRYSGNDEPEGLSLPELEPVISHGAKVNADNYISERYGLLLNDIRSRLDDVRDMAPVKTLKGTEFQKGGSDSRSLREKVSEFFASIGNKVYRRELGNITLNDAGIRDSLHHGYGPIKTSAFAAVPDVIRSGKMYGPMDTNPHDDYDTYLFIAPINYDGSERGDYYVGAYVIKDVNATRYKLHEVLTIEKEGTSRFKKGTTQSAATLREMSSGDRIPEQATAVNPDFSSDEPAPVRGTRPKTPEEEERDRLTATGAGPEVEPKTGAPKATPRESKPVLAKKQLRTELFNAFNTPDGRRQEVGRIIDSYADRLYRHGEITEADRSALLDRLYSEGVVTVHHDDNGLEAHPRIYVNDSIRADFGDDWNAFRRRAFANGIYLTRNSSDRGADSWQQTLAGQFAGIYDDNLDMRSFLEQLVQIAQDSRDERMTFDQYNAYISGKEGGDEGLMRDDLMENLERKLDNALKNFAEQANLEVYYRNREDRIRQEERRKAWENRGAQRTRQMIREAKEKERRQEMARQHKENRELREMQQKTLKQLQWLSRNRYRMPDELAATAKEILSDLDIYAVGAASATNYSNRYEATWEDIAAIYKEAKANDPNFFPSQDLERIVARLDNSKIADLDPSALADLYKAAVGLRTEFYNKQNVIDDIRHDLFQDVYDDTLEEMAAAPKGGRGNELIKSLNLEMMTPANVMQMIFGWKEDSTGNRIAQQLTNGERDMKAFEVGAKEIIKDFVDEHQDWIRKADGQGKDAIWYEVEVPELLELGMGDKPIFGKTIKVYMTPAQKIQLAIESKSKDNLRHMLGGRTFVDKDLYSKGKYQEAYAQGTTVKLAPESVEAIIKDLTPEERELADLLGNKYYNDYSGKKIDDVSLKLYGYKKTMGGWYAPIFTNQNYTNNESGLFDVTAEGIGNLKQRQYSKNPSYNISCFDAFDRNINMTKRFVGMAIPVRNWTTLMNWQGEGTSFKDELTHQWGNEYKDYIQNLLTRLQAGGSAGLKEAKLEKATNKLLSNYITAVFGANPGIVFKQAASYPQFAAVLGWDTMPKPGQLHGINTDLILTYTPELAYRMLGYSTPETATLKENPSVLDRNRLTKFLLRGGAITWMDGFTVERAWPWAENYVRKNYPELEMGSEQDIAEGRSPFYKEVANWYNLAVGTTQPMYDEMHRPNIMKDSRGVQRAFTMFKTVPLQQYNTMRKAAGEAAAAKQERKRAESGTDEDRKQEARDKEKDAARRMGNAFSATIASVLMFNLINFVDQLWRNKGKNYRDEEGNLTLNSAAKGLFSDSVDSVTGMVIYGQELTDLITNLVTGKKWYGIDIPGGEQLDEIIEEIGDAADVIRKIVTDTADITAGGGDPEEYWHRHAGDFAGAIKDIAITFGKYFDGLSVENIEKYIMGTIAIAAPKTYTMVQDFFDTPNRYDLAGLEGEQFMQRAGDLFESRGINVSDSTLEELERLYNGGYKDVIPAETASNITVDGTKYDLGANAQQQYDRIYSEFVNSALEDILASDDYTNADDKEKQKMIQTLYGYAASKAKIGAGGDQLSDSDIYKLNKAVASAEEVMEHGVSLTDWSEWKGLSSAKYPDEENEYEERGANTTEKLQMLLDFKADEDTKKALFGYIRGGYDMETEAGNPTQYAKMLDLTSRSMTIDDYLDWSVSVAEAESEADKLRVLQDFSINDNAKKDLFALLKGGRDMETETGAPSQYAKMLDVTGSGMSINDYLGWLTDTADMKKDAEKLDLLAEKNYSEKSKLAIIGTMLGTDMETEAGNPTQYAKIKSLHDSGISIDDCINLKLKDAIDRYYKAQEKGKTITGDSDMANLIVKVEDELDKLKPANGDTAVDDFQKFELIYNYAKKNSLSTEDMLAMCKVYATYDSYIPKLELATKYNVGIDKYCQGRWAMRAASMANDNNITITTTEAKTGLTKLIDSKTITREEAAILYQLQQKNWSPKKNPFDKEIAQRVYDDLNGNNTSGNNSASGSAPSTSAQLPQLPLRSAGNNGASKQQSEPAQQSEQQQSITTTSAAGSQRPTTTVRGLSLPSLDDDEQQATNRELPEQPRELQGLSLPSLNG